MSMHEETSMRTFRTIVAASFVVAASFLSPAMATSFTTDQSDAWAATGESGWGFLSFQRGSTMEHRLQSATSIEDLSEG